MGWYDGLYWYCVIFLIVIFFGEKKLVREGGVWYVLVMVCVLRLLLEFFVIWVIVDMGVDLEFDFVIVDMVVFVFENWFVEYWVLVLLGLMFDDIDSVECYVGKVLVGFMKGVDVLDWWIFCVWCDECMMIVFLVVVVVFLGGGMFWMEEYSCYKLLWMVSEYVCNYELFCDYVGDKFL